MELGGVANAQLVVNGRAMGRLDAIAKEIAKVSAWVVGREAERVAAGEAPSPRVREGASWSFNAAQYRGDPAHHDRCSRRSRAGIASQIERFEAAKGAAAAASSFAKDADQMRCDDLAVMDCDEQQQGVTLTQWVQGIASAAGEDTDARLFTARSMRVGGATELHAAGANELTIQLLGRWSSDCARLYTRASQGQVQALSRMLTAAAEDPALEQRFPDYVQTARR